MRRGRPFAVLLRGFGPRLHATVSFVQTFACAREHCEPVTINAHMERVPSAGAARLVVDTDERWSVQRSVVPSGVGGGDEASETGVDGRPVTGIKFDLKLE